MNDLAPNARRHGPVSGDSRRDTWTSMWRGFRCRCPHCGEGRMFRSYLKVADSCPACGEELHHHRADDFPAYIVIMIVGHVVVAAMLVGALQTEWPDWLHMTLWPGLALVLVFALLQPVKGAIVGLQWALRMHGFGQVATGPTR